MSILGTKAVAPFFLALLIGGCPKRQSVPRVVYVQPPAASAGGEPKEAGATNVLPKTADVPSGADGATGSTEALVIEAPPPPPPSEPVVAQAPPPATPVVQTPKRRPHPRTDSHDTEEQPDSAAPATQAEVPSLEPQSGVGRDEMTESQLQSQDDEIKRRITELDKNADLSVAERRTLKDASSFWSQAVAALRDHDRLRARELAQKASLLLAALEKR